MFLTHLTAENFGPYESIDIPLSQGLTIIIGPNGSGKSTITEIVRFCLTGSLTGTKSDAIRDDGPRKGAFASIEFQLNGKACTIRKELDSTKASMRYGGNTIHGVEEVSATLLAALELEKDTIEDVVFAPQGELTSILFQRTADREKMFHRIFGLERMPKIERALQMEATRFSSIQDFSAIKTQLTNDLQALEHEITTLSPRANQFKALTEKIDLHHIQEAYTAAQRVHDLSSEASHVSNQLEKAISVLKTLTQEAGQESERIKAITEVSNQVTGLTKACAGLETTVVSTTRILRIFEGTSAVCPICKSQITNPQQLKAEYTALVQTAEKNLAQVQTSLQGTIRKLQEMQERDAAITHRLNTATSTVENLTSRVKSLTGKVPTTLPDLGQIRQQFELAVSTQQEYAKLQSRLTALEERVITQQKQLASVEQQLAESTKIQEYVQVLTSAKGAFHYSKLPREAASFYLETLNTLTNKYMGWFAVPFNAVITPEYDIKCNIQGTDTQRKACRLSGGQKTVLALALRLALHEMFAASVGFLWLDEPTVFLDKTNISVFCDVLDNIKSAVNTEMGAQQLFVITHHEELLPHADNVIDIAALRGIAEHV